MKAIEQFRGPHAWLSNFYPVKVKFEGLTYSTVEHAYQAAKTIDPQARLWLSHSLVPGEAKRMGKRLVLRPDWEAVKLAVMKTLLRQKFQDSYLRQCLIDTGDAELVEGNWWGDRFWGKVIFGKDGPATYRRTDVGEDGGGLNHLGRLLMQIREEVRR